MSYQSAFREMVANIYGKDNVLVVHTSTIEFLDGNVLAAMLLEQILFYAGLKTSNGGSFYKRYKEWKDELYAPISRIRAAVSLLVARGLIKTQVRRVKIKDKHGNWAGRFGDTAVFYQLQWEEYEKQFSDFLKNYTEKKRRDNKASIDNDEKLQTNIPESTPIGNHSRKSCTGLSEVADRTSGSPVQDFPKLRAGLPEVAGRTSKSPVQDFSIHMTCMSTEQMTTKYMTLEQKPLKTLSAPNGADQARKSLVHYDEGKHSSDHECRNQSKEASQELANVDVPCLSSRYQDKMAGQISPNNEEAFELMYEREKKKKEPSPWDVRAAEEFAKVVSSYRKVNRTSDLRKWANVFRLMREVDKVPKKEIRETIEWYGNHIGEEYIPVAYSAEAFRRKFAEGKFTAAMKRLQKASSGRNGNVRITYENQREVPSNLLAGGGILKVEVDKDGRQYDGILLYKIRRRLAERFGRGRPLPEELKTVLREDFPEAGDIPLSVIGSVW